MGQDTASPGGGGGALFEALGLLDSGLRVTFDAVFAEPRWPSQFAKLCGYGNKLIPSSPFFDLPSAARDQSLVPFVTRLLSVKPGLPFVFL